MADRELQLLARVLALCGLALLAGGCPQSGSSVVRDDATPDTNFNDNSAGSEIPDPDCETPFVSFEAAAPWLISTPEPGPGSEVSLQIAGLEGTVSEIEIFFANREPSNCTLLANDLRVETDGRTLRIESVSEGDGPPRACTINLTATVDSCGTHVFLGLDIFDVSSEGAVTVGSDDLPVGALQLLSVPTPEGVPCDDPPDTLVGTDWSLSTWNPLDFGALPTPTEVSIDLSGFDERVEYANASAGGLAPGSDRESLYCFAELPEATVSFDGESFAISMTLENTDEDAASPCTLEFTGTVESCEVYGPSFGLDTERVLRIEGMGSFSVGGVEFDFSTFYLTPRQRPVPTVELCDEPPTSLGTDDRWRILSQDPFDRTVIEIPALDLYGGGETAESYNASVPTGGREAGEGCFAFSPGGAFFFDGSTLMFDLFSSEGEPTCDAIFTGTLASCQTHIDDRVFFSFEATVLLRFDGAGQLDIEGESVELSSLYFVLDTNPAGPVAPPVPPPVEPTPG